jgi:NTE family protein
MSGGGPVGLAWETGVVAGLAANGVDLHLADLLLGTSAGASVCAQIALGRDLSAIADRYLARQEHRHVEDAGAPRRPSDGTDVATPGQWGVSGPMRLVGQMMADALQEGVTREQARAVVGRYAMDAETVDEGSFVNFFRHLRGERWPPKFACTAVDAETGDFVVWDADNPAELDRAVAASSAVPGVFPPVTIDGRRYIDAGGVRSGASADLAAGYKRVFIVTLRHPDAPTGGAPQLERSRKRLVDELELIRDAGGTVAHLAPDALAAASMGANPHDIQVLPDAAANGRRQGAAEARRVRQFWD